MILTRQQYETQFQPLKAYLESEGQTVILIDTPAESTNIEGTDPGQWSFEIQPANCILRTDATDFNPKTLQDWLTSETWSTEPKPDSDFQEALDFDTLQDALDQVGV